VKDPQFYTGGLKNSKTNISESESEINQKLFIKKMMKFKMNRDEIRQSGDWNWKAFLRCFRWNPLVNDGIDDSLIIDDKDMLKCYKEGTILYSG
jgi:hypothetical protein